MLTTLRIKNLALVTDLTIELRPGFNAISGETGAGKSIIIGALNLVLGERADRALIRSGCENCSVEAVFDVAGLRAPLKAFLEENGLDACEESQLVLKRVFSAAGANRQFVNGSPTTLAALASIGDWLVDMHGPHDHQSLLHPARQLALLDAFGNLEKPREGFTVLLRRLAELEAESRDLIVDDKTHAQQLDLLRFQVREITAAALTADDEVNVGAEFARASNAARLLQLTQSAQGLLSEDEASLLNRAAAVGRHLRDIERLDPAASNLVALHQSAVGLLNELEREISRYAGRLDLDPARMAELEERINLIHGLKRKYGATIAEIIAFGQDARRRLEGLEHRDAGLAHLGAEIQKIKSELWRAGAELSAHRRKLITRMRKAVTSHLNDLGFTKCDFNVEIRSLDRNGGGDPRFHSAGLDEIEFQFAPNTGEPSRPLRAIASSGEMARVMLALKTVLAAGDEVPVLIFDEVDANVGGETACVVGDKMRQIARQHQVLCITHLAPVAAAAAAHYMVTKNVRDGRTISDIQILTGNARIDEIARMLGGQTVAAKKHAEELLKSGKT